MYTIKTPLPTVFKSKDLYTVVLNREVIINSQTYEVWSKIYLTSAQKNELARQVISQRNQ